MKTSVEELMVTIPRPYHALCDGMTTLGKILHDLRQNPSKND